MERFKEIALLILIVALCALSGATIGGVLSGALFLFLETWFWWPVTTCAGLAALAGGAVALIFNEMMGGG